MALEPITALAAFIALKLRNDDEGTVRASVKGKQLTSGRVGANGEIIQPTYERVEARVLKPPTKLCFKTARKHAFSDNTKPKVQYGVIYYSADDDGRRTYSYPDGESPTGEREKNASVFPSRTEGYYICQYLPDNARPYNGTGIKGWFVLNNDNRNYANSEEDAIATCKAMFNAKLEPQPEPVAPEAPPYTAPTQPDFGLGGTSTQYFTSGATGGTGSTPARPTEPTPDPTPPPTGGSDPVDPEPDFPDPEEPIAPVKPTDPFEPPKGDEPFKPPMDKEPDYKGGVDGMDKYGDIGGNGGGDYKLGGM